MPGAPGSEARQKTAILRVRLTAADLAALKERAAERNVGVATLVRAAVLNQPLRRRKALPPGVAHALADVGRVGGLLRQLRDLAKYQGLSSQATALDETQGAARRAIDAVLGYFEFEDVAPA